MKLSGKTILFIFLALFSGFFCWQNFSIAAGKININSAMEADLETLNGIGPAKAQAIIDYRTEHGPFQAIEDIQNVSGIGPATFAKIQADITVGEADTQEPPPENNPPPSDNNPAPTPIPNAPTLP